MAEQTLPREGILVAQHHFHHGFVFIVRVIRHADNTQVARTDLVYVDAGLAAVHEVTRLEIHAGLAEILETLREYLGTADASKKPYKLGVLLPNWRGYFKKEVLRGIEDAGTLLRDYSIEVIVQTCETDLPDEAVERIDELVAQHVDGIALCAKDHSSIAEKVNVLHAQGIPVVTFNSDLSGCERLCFVGQDLIRGGRVAGELMAKYLSPDDILLIAIGNPEFNAHRLRLQGFCERIYERGFTGRNLEIIETYNDYSLTYQKVRDALERHPDILGIYMANHSVSGCAEALRDIGRRCKVHVISHDLTDATKRLLKTGEIDFAIAQNIYQQGYRPLILLREYLQKHICPEMETAPIEILCSENIGG